MKRAALARALQRISFPRVQRREGPPPLWGGGRGRGLRQSSAYNGMAGADSTAGIGLSTQVCSPTVTKPRRS